MPANVSLEFTIAEKKYHEAKTLDEKLIALKEMKKSMPKHKGGEKLRAEISKKIKSLSQLIEKRDDQKKKAGGHSISVKKDGIGQIVIMGLANSGKSTLLKQLTDADVEIASYPFSTVTPEIAMMDYQKAKIQMVELPAIMEGSSKGKAMGNELLSVARNSDAIIFLVSAKTFSKDIKILLEELNASGIEIGKKKPPVKIQTADFDGITISGKQNLTCSEQEVVNYLKKRGLFKFSLVITGKAGIKEIEATLNSTLEYKNALILVNDFLESNSNIPRNYKNLQVYVWQNESNGKLKEEMFKLLDKILVYTKKPRDKRASLPLPVEIGSNVFEVACSVHKDFEKTFKYAKIWGSTKFAGQRVSKSYQVKHNDIVEIYA